MLTLGTFTA